MSEERQQKTAVSRRFVLGALTAAPVAAATGGTTAAAGVSVNASGAASMTATFKALAKMGGFPIGKIGDVLRSINMDQLADTSAQSILERVLVTGEMERDVGISPSDPRYDNWPEEFVHKRNHLQRGRIDVGAEISLYRNLKDFPNHLPFQDILSEKVLKDMYDDGSHEDFDAVFEVVRARSLREALAPYIDAETTARDLADRFQSFFQKTAEYALTNPDDFVFTERNSNHAPRGEMEGNSALDSLKRVLIDHEHETGVANPIIDRLKGKIAVVKEKNLDACYKRNQAFLKRDKARADAEKDSAIKSSNERVQQLEKERAAERQAKLDDPNLRYKFQVDLTHREGWRFVIKDQESLLTKVDWLHWAQEINAEAELKDFILSDDGKEITFCADYLKENILGEQQHRGYFEVVFPNRRAGVDLNQSPQYDEQPISQPSMSVHEPPIWNVSSLQPVASSSFSAGEAKEKARVNSRFKELLSPIKHRPNI